MDLVLKKKFKKRFSWYKYQKRNVCSSKEILIQAMIKNFLADYQHVMFFVEKKVQTAGNKMHIFVSYI